MREFHYESDNEWCNLTILDISSLKRNDTKDDKNSPENAETCAFGGAADVETRRKNGLSHTSELFASFEDNATDDIESQDDATERVENKTEQHENTITTEEDNIAAQEESAIADYISGSDDELLESLDDGDDLDPTWQPQEIEVDAPNRPRAESSSRRRARHDNTLTRSPK